MRARIGKRSGKSPLNSQSKSPSRDQNKKHTFNRAMALALRLLSRRARSRFELSTRLRQKDVSPEVIERVFTQLNDWGYLDDLQFARQWTRDRGRVRGWGPHRLRASLREKGVKPEWIDAAVGEWFSEIGEQEAAEDLLTRRFREHSGQSLGSAREKQRVFSYLYRRGYSNDVIYRAIRAVFPPDK